MKDEEYIARAIEGCVVGNGSKQISLLPAQMMIRLVRMVNYEPVLVAAEEVARVTTAERGTARVTMRDGCVEHVVESLQHIENALQPKPIEDPAFANRLALLETSFQLLAEWVAQIPVVKSKAMDTETGGV